MLLLQLCRYVHNNIPVRCDQHATSKFCLCLSHKKQHVHLQAEAPDCSIHPGTAEMPEGQRAANLQGMTRTL